MSPDLDRYRRLYTTRSRPVDSGAPEPAYEPFPDEAAADRRYVATDLVSLVPGRVIENSLGPAYVSTHLYDLSEPRGQFPLGAVLGAQPATFAAFHPTFHLDRVASYRRAAFIDTETTGLGNGAGVYCFMIGVGSFERIAGDFPSGTMAPAPTQPLAAALTDGDEPTHFVVRQFFMRSPAEEPAMLAALAQLLAPFDMAVTFNGRTFDLPLLRVRFAQNRRMLPADFQAVHLLREKQPHLDLLHPARRLWRRRLQSCRLINLEQMILGLQRSEQDVPGHLIPTLYQHYSRSGNATEMRRVFYHNAEDIVSMVALADRLNRALESPTRTSQQSAASGSVTGSAVLVDQDWLAFGQMCENRQDDVQAELAYRTALEVLRANGDRKDAFHRLAQLLKRLGRWMEAADTWQLWLTSVPGEDPTPYVELAKYCEWQINDLEQAEMWTAWALHNIRNSPHARHFRAAAAELEHRLQRIQRKRAGSEAT